ncbi:hypothetical protein RSAG8_13495, partial [Rhizoctonia solani AG-8 WAC10335]
MGPVKTVVEGFANCIGIYEEAAKGRKEYDELQVQLEAIFEELNQYFSSSPVITISIASICGSLQQELKYVKAQQARPIIRRLGEAEVDADNILECYRRIQGHLQRLSRNANISTWIIVDQMATDNRLKTLAPSLSACYNSKKATELKRGPCTTGTRTNVLAQMNQWATGRDTGNIYWMSGMAGTGKTTISYSLCEQLDAETNRMLCASFFCSRSLPECRDVGLIIPSIAYQLAGCSRPFRYALSKAMERDPDGHTRSPQYQFDSLIVQPLSDEKVKEAFPTNMVVVIDALDECEDMKSTQQILEVLLTKSKGLPIKFVVSSRPEAAIRHQMEKNGTWVDSRMVLHELDSGEVRADIKTYLTAELAPINPSEMEIKELVKRAGVLFIYAATVIRYVGYDDFGRNPRSRLDAVLGMSKQKQNTAQDQEIDQLYGAILETAISDTKLEETERDDMKLVLNTVVCAKAPLTVDALNALLNLGDVERVKAALRPLWSVLHVMGQEMTVTTLHASFPDYLTNPTRSGDSKWHCDAAAHNNILTERCFECIRDTTPQFNICSLESSYLNDDEVEDLDSRVQKSISVELRYACLYWSAHLHDSNDGAAPALMTLLEQFLANNLLLWMEVRNLTKHIATSPGDLAAVKQWATSHGATRELVNLMQDAGRFAVTVISSPVSQSTPHIYLSMLPFLPSHSPIRKHYAHRMHGMIRVDGTALDRRKALLARWSLKGNCAACTRDGTLVAIWSSFSKSCFSLIDASSGHSVRDFNHEDVGEITSLAFSPDGTRVASGTRSGIIWVWDVGSGQTVLGPLEGHESSVGSIIFSHGSTLILSGSWDNTIHIWDAYSGQLVFTPLVGHTNGVMSIAITRDNRTIISGSQDKTIRVWDMQTGRLVLDPITGHTDVIASVAISPNGKFIVSGSYGCTVRVWDVLTGQILFEPFSHNASVYSVAISPDGSFISAGSRDGTIQIWDPTGKAMSGPLKEHSEPVLMLAYSSDGTCIISYSSDIPGTLCLFDAQSATVMLDAFSGHTGPILSIDISPDGKHLVSGSWDKTLCVWDVVNRKLIHDPLTGHTQGVHFVQYSSDGNRTLSCSWDGSLHQWGTQTGDSIKVNNLIMDTSTPILSLDSQMFVSAAYSQDGSQIATTSNGGSVCIWDSITGEMVVQLIQHKTQGKSVEFSADGMTLFTGWKDGAVQIWDVQSGQLVSSIQPEGDLQVSVFAFSSDQLYNVVAKSHYIPPTMYQRNTQTGGQTPGSFAGHTSYINSVQFSSDGTCIVSGAWDKTVHIWETQTGTSIFGPLKGHTELVLSVAYSPDSTYVASASDDKTIRIWDASTEPNSTPLVEWVLNEDGWVVDGQSQRLIWVPLDLRTSLMSPRNTMLLSRDGYVRLNFEDALIGKEWAHSWFKK